MPAHRSTRAALLVAAVLGLAGCGGDGAHHDPWYSTPGSSDGSGQSGRSGNAPTVEELRDGMLWRGEYTIVVDVWAPCGPNGALMLVDRHRTTESFSLATAPPVDHGNGVRETNPFYLSAGMDLRVGGTVGMTIISTAESVDPEQDDDELLVRQYWQLEYDDGHLTGSMYQDGSPNVGEQFINDQTSSSPCQPWAGVSISYRYPLRKGATLEATLQDDRASMVVVAQSTDGTRRWRAEATATRAE